MPQPSKASRRKKQKVLSHKRQWNEWNDLRSHPLVLSILIPHCVPGGRKPWVIRIRSSGFDLRKQSFLLNFEKDLTPGENHQKPSFCFIKASLWGSNLCKSFRLTNKNIMFDVFGGGIEIYNPSRSSIRFFFQSEQTNRRWALCGALCALRRLILASLAVHGASPEV